MNDIRQLRENKKLTQVELAEILGVSRSIIAKMESKELEISHKMRSKICERFPEECIDVYFNPQNTHLNRPINIHPIDKKLHGETNYSYYYLQYLEYEKMQSWLWKIVTLLLKETERKFTSEEKKELMVCMTNLVSINSYIRSYGEIGIASFLNERKTTVNELIEKYLEELYKNNISSKGGNLNFDWL